MELKIKTEAKIGFIVLATIILVIWGINFLKGRNVLKRTDVYYAVYDNVQGLEYGAPVFINGFKVGLINNIGFDKVRLDKFIVAFVVEKQYGIPRGSVVRIASPDLISSKALMIDLAISEKVHSYGDTLFSVTEESMINRLQAEVDPIIQNTASAMMKIDSLLSDLSLLFNQESINNLKSTIENTGQLTGRINEQFSPDGKLSLTIENLENFSSALSENRDKLSNTLANISDISDTLAHSGLGETMENMTLVTEELSLLLNSINSGEGTLGMLATNDSLYLKLVDVSSSLDLLFQDMKSQPKRYVHFSLFGKKDKN